MSSKRPREATGDEEEEENESEEAKMAEDEEEEAEDSSESAPKANSGAASSPPPGESSSTSASTAAQPQQYYSLLHQFTPGAVSYSQKRDWGTRRESFRFETIVSCSFTTVLLHTCAPSQIVVLIGSSGHRNEQTVKEVNFFGPNSECTFILECGQQERADARRCHVGL